MAIEPFPSTQDIRTHRSVKAKREKSSGIDSPARRSITDPEQLAAAVRNELLREYRTGKTLVHVDIRVRESNFVTWAMTRFNVNSPHEVHRSSMHTLLERETCKLLSDAKVHGVSMLDSTLSSSAGDILSFRVRFNFSHPQPVN